MKKNKIHALFFIFSLIATFNLFSNACFTGEVDGVSKAIVEYVSKYNLKIGSVIGAKSEHDFHFLQMSLSIKKLYVFGSYEYSSEEENKNFVANKKIKFIEVSSDNGDLDLFEPDFFDFVYIVGSDNDNLSRIKRYLSSIVRGGFIFFKEQFFSNDLKKEIFDFCLRNNLETNILEKFSDFYYIRKPHKVSFIIPCYNRAGTIKRAINSIYKQNLKTPFEVVCTDDGSSDGTKKILLDYQNKYSNFKACFHKKNKGTSAARNTCILNSDGDLIFNLDSDNFFEPNSIRQLIDLIDFSGCEAAVFGEVRYFIDNKNKWTHSCKYKKDIYDLWDIAKGKTPISGGNYLFKRKIYDAVGGYSGRIRETWVFGFRKLAIGARIVILRNSNKNFYWHSVSKDSKWKHYEKLGKNDIVTLGELKKHPELFLSETNKLINTYNVRNKKLIKDLWGGHFKFIPKKALKYLFEAYWYERNKMYQDAIIEYKKAIKNGCDHAKVYAMLKNAEEKASRVK